MPVNLDLCRNVRTRTELKKIKFLSALNHICSCAGERCYGHTFIYDWNKRLKSGLVQPITSTKALIKNIKTKHGTNQLVLKSSIIENLSTSLDTIIAEGNNILTLNRTYQDWVVESSMSNDAYAKIDAEDREIYSHLSNVKYQQQINDSDLHHNLFRWPIIVDSGNERSKKRNRDNAWNLRYSDDVSMDEFYQSQSIFPLKRIKNNSDTPIKNPLNEMVHKSWERAISIVSNTISCTHEDETNKKDTNISSHLLHKKATAILMCKEHGIFVNDIVVNNNSYCCAACRKRLKFRSNKEVMDHLFGSEIEEGCCWNLIRPHQAAAAKTVMEREVMNIVDSLLHPLLMNTKQQVQQGENDPSRIANRGPLNWKDVCNIWRKSIATADAQGEIDPESPRNFDKTMKVCDNTLPIPFNHDIVQITEQILVKRYVKSNK